MKQLILTLLLIALIGCSTTTQNTQQPFSTEVTQELQTTIDELTVGELPPGMVVWIDTPEHRFEGSSGSANLSEDVSMPTDGAFRIGSVTKMFTAAVIVQLTEDGTLSLDDPLAQWLPDVAAQLPHGDQITLYHLLTHTSGLFNIVEHEAYFADLFSQMVVDEAAGTASLACVERDPNDTLARYVYGKDAYFEPGAAWYYSNTNYALLGMVIEQATAQPLAEAYRTQLYEPLGMSSTFLDCYEESLVDVVHGYSGVGEGMSDVTELHESVGWAAGGLVSTADDLTKFARGLFGGELFEDDASLTALMTPAPNSSYGLGVSVGDGTVGHAGYIGGYRSLLSYTPELDAVVVLLYNSDSADPEQALAEVMEPVLPSLRVEN